MTLIPRPSVYEQVLNTDVCLNGEALFYRAGTAKLIITTMLMQ